MQLVLTIKISTAIFDCDCDQNFDFQAYNMEKNKIWLKDHLQISLLVLSKFKRINQFQIRWIIKAI